MHPGVAAVNDFNNNALAFAPKPRGKPRVWELKAEAWDVEPLTEEEFSSLSNTQLSELFVELFDRADQQLPPGERAAPPSSSNRGWYFRKLVERRL
jgi:hypothetical protein